MRLFSEACAQRLTFFLDGVRDDVQYYRPLYNLEQVEILRGPKCYALRSGWHWWRGQSRHQKSRDWQICHALIYPLIALAHISGRRCKYGNEQQLGSAD